VFKLDAGCRTSDVDDASDPTRGDIEVANELAVLIMDRAAGGGAILKSESASTMLARWNALMLRFVERLLIAVYKVTEDSRPRISLLSTAPA
jgi:hypothetical protein